MLEVSEPLPIKVSKAWRRGNGTCSKLAGKVHLLTKSPWQAVLKAGVDYFGYSSEAAVLLN